MMDISFRVILGLALWFGSVAPVFSGTTELPKPPAHFVFDEAGILSRPALREFRSLLSEHAHQTQEQVVVAIFKSLGQQDLVSWTHQIYQHWGIGQKGKDRGLLIALYWQEHLIRFEVGYGFESVITDAQSKRIIESVMIPAFKKGDPDHAVGWAIQDVLKLVESPVLKANSAASRKKSRGLDWLELLVLGALFVLIAVLRFFFPSVRHRSRRWPPGGDWGGPPDSGSPGSWGGGSSDSFRGGGGSSGGGGASGKW